MRRVYISFLGTSNYLPCTYHDETGKVENVRFVQEATLKLKCSDWLPDDQGFIFTTSDAEAKNWHDAGHTDFRTGHVIQAEGLESRIRKLELPFSARHIGITDGFDQGEIWQNFETVYGCLQEGDKVSFDITHAFRSIPLLAIAVLNYARVMKKVRLDGIYYGAFEVLGTPQQARNMTLEERIVPVFDLTPLDLLMQWSLALDRFIGAGDAQPLANLADEAVAPILKATRGGSRAAISIRSISKRVAEYTATMSTCRGKQIVPITQIIKKELEKFERLDLIPAFQPLFERLRRQFQPFNGEELNDGIQAARWCLKRNLIQQGYTILREILVSHVVSRVPDSKPENEKDRRAIASSAFAIKAGEKLQNDWRGQAAAYPEFTRKCIALLEGQGDLVNIFNELANYRNDLNHAGFRPNMKKADKFKKKLTVFIDRVEALFRG